MKTYQEIEIELDLDVYNKLIEICYKENITLDQLAERLLKEKLNETNPDS